MQERHLFFSSFLLRGRSSARTVDKTDERTDPVGVRAIMLRAVARCPYDGVGTELLALNAQIAPITISKYTLHFQFGFIPIQRYNIFTLCNICA